ncbi:MAG TPA: SMP-30/gluconolactonase/LRE family protein [Chloroflexia bacterium]|nr:SMP-30/gluconolactonase/LRE family protein [Chloroflexia bacterium]
MNHRIFRKIALTAALAVALGGPAAVSLAAPAAQSFDAYTLPGTNVFPEGIGYDTRTGDFYTGSTTSGTIYRGNIARPDAEVFVVGTSDGITTTRGMKVDAEGHLFVATGPQAMMLVYDTATKALLAKLPSGVQPSNINDVALAPNGDAYFTDSSSLMVYRVSHAAGGQFAVERLDLSGSRIQLRPGFNFNGLAVSADGRYLVLPQTNTGKLYSLDLQTSQVSQVDLGTDEVTGADGILLNGQILQVSRNAAGLIVYIELSSDFRSGKVVQVFSRPEFQFPTTIARAGNRLLVVNSQFNRRNSGQPPSEPFQILSIEAPLPGGSSTPGMPTTGAPAPWPLAVGLALLLLLGGGSLRRRATAR